MAWHGDFPLPNSDSTRELVRNLSKLLNVKTESLAGDVSFGTRVSIQLRNGKTLIVQSHDADGANFVAMIDDEKV
jgi:hypothetical protein